MNICIIPARGGSKRIPRKNIKEFRGKPIIAYSIETALNSGLFSEVMVSTDDLEIAEISMAYGAKVPFMRSEKNSDDFSGPGDVVFEVLNKYKEIGREFKYGCCLYATSPLITISTLNQGFELLTNDSGFDVIFPVGRFNSPIWRSYNMKNDGEVAMNFSEYERSRSQDLPEAYYDAGQFYWFNTGNIETLENKNTFGVKKGVIVLNDVEVQDIDDMSDWQIAEIKYEHLIRNGVINV